MSVLKKLLVKKLNKPYLGFAKLAIGNHKIEGFKIVKNKYADKNEPDNKTSIMVELYEEILYLPPYFRTKLSDADVDDLNKCISENENVYLYFGGKQKDSK